MFALDYDQLCWSTQDGFALESIRLRIPQGSFFGLLGPEGCGKSALLRLTMGLLRPDSGTITVLGSDSVMGSRDIRRQCTYVPAQLPAEAAYGLSMRVREYLAGAISLRRRVDHSRIGELCHRFDLDMKEKLRTLDEAERKRLLLVMGLLSDSPLLILDEPSLYLTRPERQLLFAELTRMHESGSTIFFTTRSVAELDRYTTHCAMMADGAILCGGETAQMDILRTHRVTLRAADDPVTLTAALGIHNFTHTDGLISFFYTGDMDRLVKTLANFPIHSLRIEDPTLESVTAAYHIMGGSVYAQTV